VNSWHVRTHSSVPEQDVSPVRDEVFGFVEVASVVQPAAPVYRLPVEVLLVVRRELLLLLLGPLGRLHLTMILLETFPLHIFQLAQPIPRFTYSKCYLLSRREILRIGGSHGLLIAASWVFHPEPLVEGGLVAGKERLELLAVGVGGVARVYALPVHSVRTVKVLLIGWVHFYVFPPAQAPPARHQVETASLQLSLRRPRLGRPRLRGPRLWRPWLGRLGWGRRFRVLR